MLTSDDTVYAQNLFVKFAGYSDSQKIKIGVKESDSLIDFVTVKAYIFPYVNLVWLGLIIMAIGIIMSMIKRAETFYFVSAAVALIFAAAAALLYVSVGKLESHRIAIADYIFNFLGCIQDRYFVLIKFSQCKPISVNKVSSILGTWYFIKVSQSAFNNNV